MDKRASKLADLVLDYSIELKDKDKLIIQFDPAYVNYANIIAKKARDKGAEVRYDSMTHDPNVLRNMILFHDEKQWQEELNRRIELAKWCTARILIDCKSNPNYAKGIKDASTYVAEFNKKVIGPYRKVLFREGPNQKEIVKWNIVGFPSVETAARVGLSFDKYADFVYTATLKTNWQEMSEQMKRIKKVFDGAKDIHIIVPKLTDLHLSLSDRKGEICDGKLNMPDGEICYGPLENSANGYIHFQHPTKRDGLGIIEGIKLEFENGNVKKYSSRTNKTALEKTLNIDDGAKRIGELGIGCNYSITKPTLETLFDEKIGGTIHLALGESLNNNPNVESGGLNRSSIHWDIVCDLRKDKSDIAKFPGGQIYVDNVLVQKSGIWKI